MINLEIINRVIPEIINYPEFRETFVTDIIPNLTSFLPIKNSTIHETAKVHSQSRVINSFIGKNVTIYEGCTVRDSIILDNTIIGHCSEVARSVILKNCILSRFNYIGSSLVGENTVISRACLASERFDYGTITLKIGKFQHYTGVKKYGSIIGSNAEICQFAVLNPGSIIGKNSRVCPHVNFKGFLPENTALINQIISQEMISLTEIEIQARSTRIKNHLNYLANF